VASSPRPQGAPAVRWEAPAGLTAVEVVAGELGTKGGVLTDADARVLREDGTVIEGLYAAGNTSASVMGRTYPGPGSTLGPACVFGYIAAKHAARQPAAVI
jgi:3-oxosteroid 1-dehydrogenase